VDVFSAKTNQEEGVRFSGGKDEGAVGDGAVGWGKMCALANQSTAGTVVGGKGRLVVTRSVYGLKKMVFTGLEGAQRKRPVRYDSTYK